jgi:hypothetical protein
MEGSCEKESHAGKEGSYGRKGAVEGSCGSGREEGRKEVMEGRKLWKDGRKEVMEGRNGAMKGRKEGRELNKMRKKGRKLWEGNYGRKEGS